MRTRPTQGSVGTPALVGAAILAFITLATLLVPQQTETGLSLSPQSATVDIGAVLPIDIVVTATEPVNAFTGDIIFNNEVFSVDRIEYNTSIAELWVTEPWYSKADNTVYFAGGTTKEGGFVGDGVLMTLYLKAERDGFVNVSLEHARILRHDGLGTDVPLPESIDALFTSEPKETVITEVASIDRNERWYRIGNATPSTDLNEDGKTGIRDLSIFMLNLGSTDTRYDLNQDGDVNLKDLSVLMNAL